MRIHSREATSGPTIELKEDLAMSTIEIDEKLRQGRRRWLGSKSSTNRLGAPVAAFILATALPGCAAFPKATTIELASGHLSLVSHPREIAGLILTAAGHKG
jgi:hypothetical protein